MILSFFLKCCNTSLLVSHVTFFLGASSDSINLKWIWKSDSINWHCKIVLKKLRIKLIWVVSVMYTSVHWSIWQQTKFSLLKILCFINIPVLKVPRSLIPRSLFLGYHFSPGVGRVLSLFCSRFVSCWRELSLFCRGLSLFSHYLELSRLAVTLFFVDVSFNLLWQWHLWTTAG